MPPLRFPNVPIAGIHNVSAINYPGKIAACIFTQGCNLCCPYCHNQELLPRRSGKIEYIEVLSYVLLSRRLIDGVVITGGEPTIHPDLPKLIARIKQEDLLVKLDTNGTNPDMLKELIEGKLIDAIAMDIKTSPNKYKMLRTDITAILHSISLIVRSGLDYEFRTTIDGELCTDEDVERIQRLIPKAKKYTTRQAERPGQFNGAFLNPPEEIPLDAER